VAASSVEPATVFAPDRWRAIDFISDLHLTAATPRTVSLWSKFLHHTQADAVFILGDLFEAWVGDDARNEGFEAGGAEILRSAAATRAIAFMVGNRDFLLGAAMLQACNVMPLEDPTLLCAFGDKALLSHGDALCLADVPYQQFRRVVRDPAWQRDFLERPLSERRALARALRDESERHKRAQSADSWVDVDTDAALAALKAVGAATLIHGHTHRPGSEELAVGRWRHVLSDWDVDDAVAPRAQVLRWQSDGVRRLTPDEAIGAGPS
jgi:UDP-2,3-diacylglucosamine hydrolase